MIEKKYSIGNQAQIIVGKNTLFTSSSSSEKLWRAVWRMDPLVPTQLEVINRIPLCTLGSLYGSVISRGQDEAAAAAAEQIFVLGLHLAFAHNPKPRLLRCYKEINLLLDLRFNSHHRELLSKITNRKEFYQS